MRGKRERLKAVSYKLEAEEGKEKLGAINWRVEMEERGREI